MKRVVFCWAGLSGYMAACWRALQGRVNLRVLAFAGEAGSAPFAAGLMEGIDATLLDAEKKEDGAYVAELVTGAKPDVVVLCGWFHKPYTALVKHPALQGVKFVMGMDNPWLGTARQKLARLRVGSFVQGMDAVVVTGERSFRYARQLGVDESRIYRGVYGIDYAGFLPLYERRLQQPGGWPKRFLYLGRYAPVKAIDVLLEAYGKYRAGVREPWPLTCCGTGPLKGMLSGVAGVTDMGFQQPSALGGIMAEHGVLVLASRYDPWPLVVVEANAAGLPVVCTEACGSAVETVRPLYNGYLVGTDDAGALAGAMTWMHEHHAELPEMGRRAQQMAAPYSAEMWARRWERVFEKLEVGSS